MLALAPKGRIYPVLLPDRPAAGRAPVRRPRRRPLANVVVAAVLLVAPAVVLVAQRTDAARTGYEIFALQHDVAALQADNARLLATVTALRGPERIERIATRELGMTLPRPQQVAALPVPAPRVLAVDVAPLTIWERLGAWLGRSEAAAGEPAQ